MTSQENHGKTTLSPDVLVTVARMSALSVEGVSRMAAVPPRLNRLFRSHASSGVDVTVEDDVVSLELFLILKSDVNVRDVSRNVQRSVSRAISEMIGMEVGHVNIHVEDIDYEEKAEDL